MIATISFQNHHQVINKIFLYLHLKMSKIIVCCNRRGLESPSPHSSCLPSLFRGGGFPACRESRCAAGSRWARLPTASSGCAEARYSRSCSGVGEARRAGSDPWLGSASGSFKDYRDGRIGTWYRFLGSLADRSEEARILIASHTSEKLEDCPLWS